MRRFWLLVPVLVLFAVLVLTATPASAQGGRTVFGQPVTIESGETVDGNLVSFGGPVTVERGAKVEGDVVSWGGPVTIAGRVEGDVVSVGGPVSLRNSAVIEGDVALMGGPLSRSEGAVVRGDVVEGFRFGDLRRFRFTVPPVPPVSRGVRVEMGNGSGFLSFILSLLTKGITAVVLAGIALLVLIFIPEQTNIVKQMARDQSLASAGVGCLTMFVVVLVFVGLFFTVCGWPILPILALVSVMAVLYGWIALGVTVGERILTALHTERPLPLISGVIGVLVITLLALLVPLWLGLPLALVGLSWGLGAVVLSRGGTRRYPSLPGGRAWTPAPTAPPPPEPAGGVPPAEPETVPAVEEWPEAPPVQPAKAMVEGLDDLKVIKGIGPVYERMLREAGGIRTYRDLASRSPQELIEAVSGPSVIPTSVESAQRWIEEARRLATEHRE
ncbi:MAG: helix-hairpin-helix domain-containing protein [Anaerolineae bacterium]